MYAQVVFNLPIEGPFDYLIPPAWEKNIKAGIRIWVSFGKRHCLGYVVGKTRTTQANKLKPILRIIDDIPILDKTMLKITRQVADYYACSWGEAIEAATPVSLRRAKAIRLISQEIKRQALAKKPDILLLQDITGQRRWEVYFREIKNSLKMGKSVIMLTPDKESAQLSQKRIQDRLNIEVGLLHSYQSAKKELEQWIDLKRGRLRKNTGQFAGG